MSSGGRLRLPFFLRSRPLMSSALISSSLKPPPAACVVVDTVKTAAVDGIGLKLCERLRIRVLFSLALWMAPCPPLRSLLPENVLLRDHLANSPTLNPRAQVSAERECTGTIRKGDHYRGSK